MSNKMWMVRAGEKAYLVQDFEEKEYVALGWPRLSDLSHIESKEDLEKVYKEAYPEDSIHSQRMGIGQVYRFRSEIKTGDMVVTYNPELRIYLVGEIISDYQYVLNSPGNFNHIRKVKWLGKVPRDNLSVATKNTIGAIMTLFLLGDSAKDEITMLLSGKKLSTQDAEEDAEITEMEELKKDTIERSIEFIKDKLLKLDWDKMQELVCGILKAMGYRARETSPGPDRGVDIIASPDGLGLEQPRIRVEVKHRAGAIGAPDLRSFLGGLRQNDKGLYVSTGGFTREARYEAERSTVPVTLIDIDELADLLRQNYDSADAETKALVPLVKLYWPA